MLKIKTLILCLFFYGGPLEALTVFHHQKPRLDLLTKECPG